MTGKSKPPKKPSPARPLNGRPSKIGLCAFCGNEPRTDHGYTCADRAEIAGEHEPCITVGDRIIENLGYGMSTAGAAEEAGVQQRTFNNWRNEGLDALARQAEGYDLTEQQQHRLQFFLRSQHARRKLERKLTRLIDERIDAKSPDDKVAIDILRRLAQEKWNVADKVQHSGSVEVNIVDRFSETMAAILRDVLDQLGLTDEQLTIAPEIVERVLERYTAQNPEVTT